MAPDLVPKLVERSGSHVGRVHSIPDGRHILGRDAKASVRLDDVGLSREHAQLDVSAAGLVIRDLGSKNGVLVDGQPLQRARLLVHGDTFCVAGIVLELVHPASQVNAALSRAGETTVTRAMDPTVAVPQGRPIALPLLAVAFFAALLAAMLFLERHP